jgi:hypothetical protein
MQIYEIKKRKLFALNFHILPLSIQSSSQRCPYRIRWNEKSGRLWESGEHNHEPIEKRWNFVAKFQAMNANSMNALRRQYMVRKDSENVHKMKFRCVLAMQKRFLIPPKFVIIYY